MPFWRSSVASPSPARPASATEHIVHANKDDASASTTSTLLCPTCGRRYDDGKRRRVTYVGCGHVICRKCSRRDSRRSGSCPFCAAAAKTTHHDCDIIRPASGTDKVQLELFK